MVETKLVKTKKKWYPIAAPKAFDDAFLGEVLVAEPSVLVGRVLTANLASITGNIKHQNIALKFRVTCVADNKAQTEFIYYEMMPSAIKRFVRRGTMRIDDSVICETADNKFIRVKPMLLTRAKTQGSKLKALRRSMLDIIKSEAKKSSYEELAISLISFKLQMEIKQALKKIYPLKSCEIKRIELVKRERDKKKTKTGEPKKADEAKEEQPKKTEKPQAETQKKAKEAEKPNKAEEAEPQAGEPEKK